MKNLKKLFALALVLCFAAALIPATALASTDYTYTVRIFAGAQGLIDGQEVVEYTGLTYGSRVDFNIGRVTLNSDNGKYYVKGIRESGKDNNTVSSPSIYVTQDIDYVVAYGISGSSVAYTVNYQDEEGNELFPSMTYYGNIGDKPVLAYQYIDGYQPQAYNLTKTLSENAAENVFTFIYTTVDQLPGEITEIPGGVIVVPEPETPPEVDIPNPEVPETNPDQQGDQQQGNQPPQLMDLDDGQVPQAGPGGDRNNNVTGSDGPNANPALSTGAKVAIASGSAVTAGMLIWLAIIMMRKKKKKEA